MEKGSGAPVYAGVPEPFLFLPMNRYEKGEHDEYAETNP